MQINLHTLSWWGAPKKFDQPEENRRVSWLELFYDLVYVIAISRVTHHFSMHINLESFLEYTFLFVLIFWGWLNGSLHHDMHGNEGLRTRLMTLWQMVIIAALAVVIDQPREHGYFNITIVFMIMQLYITYMWWSVGIYDRKHRKYNRPYTVFYLISLVFMGLSLFVQNNWFLILLPLILICNYSPPFLSHHLLRSNSSDLNLSSSMFERLGLFAIIVFGELVLGVVNGMSEIQHFNAKVWLDFALAISIVFSLWWIFFTLVAQREVKKGFINATLLELLYIPSLVSLGLIAVSFTTFFADHNEMPIQRLSYAIAVFLICIGLMTNILVSPEKLTELLKPGQISLYVSAALFLITAFLPLAFNHMLFLIVILVILILEITFLNSMYYRIMRKRDDR